MLAKRCLHTYAEIILLVFAIVPRQLFGQVNTEKLRNYEAQKGIQNTAGLGFGFLAGNSDQYRVAANYRLDWLTTNYYSFLILNYERGKSGGDLFTDKGFLHARATRDLSASWIAEAFFQKEFNKLILLKDRRVVGAGLRYEIRNIDTVLGRQQKLFLGVGAGLMHEREITTDPHDKKTLVRSTNYVSLTWKPDVRMAFSSTAYFQMDIQRSSDYRLINESSLSFSITKAVSFLTTASLRFDHEPPPDIKKYDLSVTNGITVQF
ncbi:DUF481 domain-containing protein [bacterium]|nr:DUF481 domain-containing protein [bacterium]